MNFKLHLPIDEFVVIGDIAGRYNELQLLLTKFPDNLPVILVGDLNDRGKDSNKVIQFCINNSRVYCTQSNHGSFIVNVFEDNLMVYRNLSLLAMNGGLSTLKSYGIENDALKILENMALSYAYGVSNGNISDIDITDTLEKVRLLIPQSHYEYLRDLPYVITTNECLVTHAPINPTMSIEKQLESSYRREEFIWNRGNNRRMDKFQIHGHNAFRNPMVKIDKNGCFTCNVDTSRGDKLTALHVKKGIMRLTEQEILSNCVSVEYETN